MKGFIEQEEAYEMGRAESGGDGRLDVLLGDAHRFFLLFAGVLRTSGKATDLQARRRLGRLAQAGGASLYFFYLVPKNILAEQ